MKEPWFVAVIGSARCDGRVAELARQVGAEIARSGAVLVCGGKGGVMEAACQGAKSQGGTTVGILPGTDRCEANPFVDVPVVTGMGQARNAIVVSSGDVIIALSGGYGTLSEVGMALKLGKPVVGLGTWVLPAVREGAGRAPEPFIQAESPSEAVRLALGLVGGAGSEPGNTDKGCAFQ